MVTELISKHTPLTVRQQFDAIIEQVREEALAAARTLGFDCKSKPKLFAALQRELEFWNKEYCWEVEALPCEMAEYPKPWSRVVCVQLILNLLEEDTTADVFESVAGGSFIEILDDSLKELRSRLDWAANTPKPDDLPRGLRA